MGGTEENKVLSFITFLANKKKKTNKKLQGDTAMFIAKGTYNRVFILYHYK
jgi:hypothetical protein